MARKYRELPKKPRDARDEDERERAQLQKELQEDLRRIRERAEQHARERPRPQV